MNHVLAELERELDAASARVHHVAAIYSADWRVSRRALRAYYAAASEEINSSPADEWAIDVYEVDWLRLFTPIERALWFDIRLCGAVLYPQYPVGRFFVDFGNPSSKVAIECDEKIHDQRVQEDASRQAEIEQAGWTVYRISGRNCFDAGETWFDQEGTERTEWSAAERLIRLVIERHGVGVKKRQSERERLAADPRFAQWAAGQPAEAE